MMEEEEEEFLLGNTKHMESAGLDWYSRFCIVEVSGGEGSTREITCCPKIAAQH